MNHLIAITIVSSVFGFLHRLFKNGATKEQMAAETKEYDDIRSTIFLCISSKTLFWLEIRIEAFKSKNILPKELHIQMCDRLESLFNEKYGEVIEMENMVSEAQKLVNV